MRQCLLSQRVDALPLRLSSYSEPLVKFWMYSKFEPTRVVPAWLDDLFFADLEEDRQGLPELCSEFLRGLAVEVGSAINTENLAPELNLRVYSIFALYPSTVITFMASLRVAQLREDAGIDLSPDL